MHKAALAGLKVIDLSRVLAGPWATQTLGDLGAKVIKIERPGSGDDTRSWGPPDFDEESSISAYFSCTNRNKESIAVDLKSDEGVNLVKRLMGEADVVVENYKVGYMASLGLDYASVAPINPGVIYCSITGFGQNGPYKDKPGYDLLIQAMCGLMSVTGSKEREPQKAGVAVTDIFTGLYATTAILAALHERRLSGLGQYIDLALLDVGISIMANQASNFLATGKAPTRMGNAHPNIVPYQSFATADQHCVIAVGNDQQFQRFCDVLSISHIACDKKFESNSSRVKHRKELVDIIQQRLVTQPRDYWLSRLDESGIPCAPVNNIAESLSDPAVTARGLLVDMTAEHGQPLPIVGSPINLSRTPVIYEKAPPALPDSFSEEKQLSLSFW